MDQNNWHVDGLLILKLNTLFCNWLKESKKLHTKFKLTRSIRDSETSIDFVQGPPGSRRERVNPFSTFGVNLVTSTST